jgi:hypothetical protein
MDSSPSVSLQHYHGKIQKSIITLDLEAKKRGSFWGKFLVITHLNRGVKNEISDVVDYFNKEHGTLKDDTVKTIAFNILSKFSEKEFNRCSLNEAVITKLKSNLDLGENPNSEIVKEVMFGLKMGVNPIKNKGAYGSLIYRNYKGESIAIFKNMLGSPLGFIYKIGDCVWKLLKLTCQRYHLPFEKERNLGCGLSEIASYYFSSILGFHLVPDTYMVKFEKKMGSLQEFVTGYREAKNISIADSLNGAIILEFQAMCVLDYLIGNLDRHLENWLVKVDGTNQITSIKMIDNGNAFIRNHLPDKLGKNPIKNQYAWKKLAPSKLKIQEDIKNRICQLNSDAVEEILKRIKYDYPSYEKQINNFFGVSKEALLERIRVLQKVAREDKSLSELAEFVSETQIKEYIVDQLLPSDSSSSSTS